MNQNSSNNSVLAEDDPREIEEQIENEPITCSFIDINILKELQRELHLLDVENEFDVKVIQYFIHSHMSHKNT